MKDTIPLRTEYTPYPLSFSTETVSAFLRRENAHGVRKAIKKAGVRAEKRPPIHGPSHCQTCRSGSGSMTKGKAAWRLAGSKR